MLARGGGLLNGEVTPGGGLLKGVGYSRAGLLQDLHNTIFL